MIVGAVDHIDPYHDSFNESNQMGTGEPACRIRATFSRTPNCAFNVKSLGRNESKVLSGFHGLLRHVADGTEKNLRVGVTKGIDDSVGSKHVVPEPIGRRGGGHNVSRGA